MRLLIALACLLAGCLASPHPCYTPPLLTGALTVSTQNEKMWAFGKYIYDGIEQRVRVFELVNYNNQSMTFDFLLHYREAVVYQISDKNRTCTKSPLKEQFHPWHVPKDATLVGPAVLGSSSGPGEGLLVNTWMGDLPSKTGKYITTVTEYGCIPVSTLQQTEEFGWVATNLMNNVKGVTDPSLLDPPAFCTNVATSGTEPEDMFSLLHKNTK